MMQVGDLVMISNSILRNNGTHGIVMEIKGKYHVKIANFETGHTTIISKSDLIKLEKL